MRLARKPHTVTFGADDQLSCPACKEIMTLTRRTPHPEYRDVCELRTFECSGCQIKMTRSVDRDGNPP
jgi:hypothetical protein